MNLKRPQQCFYQSINRNVDNILFSPQKLPAKQNKQKKATPFKNYLLPAHTKDKIPVLFEHFLLLKCLVTNKEIVCLETKLNVHQSSETEHMCPKTKNIN